jgi:outer membrane receptor protein involved in Fe transport
LAANLAMMGTVSAQENLVHFDIPAENAAKALIDFSKQANVQILYPYDMAAKHDTAALRGDFTRENALRQILDGTGLEVANETATTISLRAVPASGKSATANGEPSTQVIVTGSRIRNAQPTSPLHVITHADIEQSGYSQVGDLVRSLPEDFGGGQNPGVMGASGSSIGNQNLTNASSVNLRGLGTDATLVLLDNHRLSADSFFQGSDISAIPLSAVQRVEVVPDGASAIYGSDAVAGVVNFVMRKDYNGTEVSARAGGASQSGSGEETMSVLSGRAGVGGHILGDVEYSRMSAVSAEERRFAEGAPPDEYLLRPQTRKSLYLDAGKNLSDTVRLSFDGLVSDRQSATLTHRTVASRVTVGNVYTPSYSGATTLDIGSPGNWMFHATAGASGSRNLTWSGASKAKGSFTFRKNGTDYVELTADGILARLPSGDVKVALGAGYRGELYRNNHPGSTSYISASRHVSYAYGEAYVPLVAPSAARAGLHALDLNLSARTEHYSDFGGTTNPKIGLRYVPFSDVTLRASWGTSFKAPSFTQMYQGSVVELWTASDLGYSGPGTAFLVSGGNSGLKPEKSRSWTFGGDFNPMAMRSLTLSATYFNIDYRERVVDPVSNYIVGLSSPIYASFVKAATPARQAALLSGASLYYNFSGTAYDPNTVVAILDDSYQNATSQAVHGIDLSYRQTFLTSIGRLDTFANATWLRLEQQTIPTASVEVLTGTLFNAPDFKARGGLSWQGSRWSLTGTVNFIDAETDTGTTPPGRIASWTTVDGTAIYRFGGQGFGRGLKVVGAASNLFDKTPPHAISPATTFPGLGFDSTNTSILGRFCSLTLVKAW